MNRVLLAVKVRSSKVYCGFVSIFKKMSRGLVLNPRSLYSSPPTLPSFFKTFVKSRNHFKIQSLTDCFLGPFRSEHFIQILTNRFLNRFRSDLESDSWSATSRLDPVRCFRDRVERLHHQRVSLIPSRKLLSQVKLVKLSLSKLV